MRNALNKKKTSDYDFRLKVNEGIWKRSYNKMEPKDKKFSPCFIPVPKWNPFFLKETDDSDDKLRMLY